MKNDTKIFNDKHTKEKLSNDKLWLSFQFIVLEQKSITTFEMYH